MQSIGHRKLLKLSRAARTVRQFETAATLPPVPQSVQLRPPPPVPDSGTVFVPRGKNDEMSVTMDACGRPSTLDSALPWNGNIDIGFWDSDWANELRCK